MNIIDKLHELVTPKVLELVGHYTGSTENKTQLLSSVYGIIGARLSDSDAVKRIESLLAREPEASNNGSKLLDALLQDEKGNPQASLLSSELSQEHDLPESTATAMLATATPMILDNIKILAGDRGIVGFLEDKLEDLARHMPAWAVAILPAGLLATIAGLAGSLKSSVGSTVSGLASGASSAVTGLASGASNFAGKAASGVSGAASEVADTAKDAVGAVADGGKAAAGLAAGAVLGAGAVAAGAVGALASGVKNVAGGAKDVAEDAVDAAAAGTKAVAGAVTDSAKDAAGAVADGGKAVAGAVLGAGAAAVGLAGAAASGAKNAAGSAVDSTKAVAGAAADSAKDAVGAVAGGVSSAASSVASGVTETAKQGGGLLKSLLPIIGLIILGVLAWLMLRGCQDNKTPVAAPTASPSTSETTGAVNPNAAPATLNIATDDQGNALYTCRGQAGNEGVFAKIRTALSGVFGTADKCDLQVSNDHGELAVDDTQLQGLFGLLKGVPNASMSLDGKTLRFNASNDADIAKLIEGAKGLLPADFVIEAEPKLDAAAAVSNSIDTAKTALSELVVNDSGNANQAEELVRALNIQIINFATSSNAIPDANKEILNLAAEKLAALPDARLKITGHTDSQGNHASNQKLSERRATAVRDYLVSKGVSADRLETFGASSDHPIASNATEQGRFQNRRIEFALVEKDGTTTTVGHAENGQPADNAPQAVNTSADTEADKTQEKTQ